MSDKPKQEYAAVGKAVFNNLSELVARAKSANFAKRIANALNSYATNRRGQ